MYCPRCGQQQISEQTKFCSRCGFQLALVGEVLANNGTLPQLEQLYNQKTGWLTRRNGVTFSIVWLIFFLLIMAPFWGIANVEELAGISAVIGIFGGLIWLIISLVMLKKPAPRPVLPADILPHAQQPVGLYGNPAQQAALPPQQSQPASDYVAPQGAWRTPDTGEFAVPGSVTETTTKLLNKND